MQPEDIRYALERSLSLGSTGGYYETIVGAAACRTGPHRCDLHRGIEVDRTTNTVTFHLTRPDPDFLYKLALRAAAAVPTGTPIRILRRHPPPGTGPYMVDRVGPDRFEFVPNPHFQEWSRAAKPAGYIHKLVFEVPQNPAAAVRAVVQGRADIADIDQPGTIPRALLSEILTRYRSRVHFSPLLSTIFLFMNTRLAPFDDVRVRQALNYAVDRRKVVQLFGQHPDSITCQILPPGFLGYHRFCPYTRDPSDRGNWTAPDLAKARKLVRASGTRGMPVTVWEVSSLAGPRVARLLAGVLQTLGYRPRIRFLKDLDTFAAYISDSKNRVQIGGWGWGADYPAPSTFFSALLTCKSFVPNSPANDNRASSAIRASTATCGRPSPSRSPTFQRGTSVGKNRSQGHATGAVGPSPQHPARQLRLETGGQLPVQPRLVRAARSDVGAIGVAGASQRGGGGHFIWRTAW